MINMIADDLNATYGGTCLGLRDSEGVIEPYWITDCHEDNVLRGRAYGEIVEIDINDRQLVLEFPDSGVYGTHELCFYVERRANRQWRRGIVEREVSIVGDISFGHELVRAMFNPVYKGYAEALEYVMGKDRASLALDRNFWLRSMSFAEYPLIMFRGRVVGEVQDKPLLVNPAMESLFQEVKNENP